MNLTKLATAAILAFSFTAPAVADNSRMLEDIIAKECQAQAGMVTKAAFMKAVEKRFDMVDKGNKGMISTKDAVMIITGNQKLWTPAY